MRKTFIIAARDYLAAVRTKSFLISLILLPIMMCNGLIAQRVSEKFADITDKKIAVIDHTDGAALYRALAEGVDRHNTAEILDKSGRQTKPRFVLERVEPASIVTDPAAADRQRLEISDRIRAGQLFAFVEIDSDVFAVPASTTNPDAAANSENDDGLWQLPAAIHYTTNRPAFRDFFNLLNVSLTDAVRERRMNSISPAVPYISIRSSLQPPPIQTRGLAERRPDGSISYEPKEKQTATIVVPLLLLALLFVVVFVGASPMTANVIEEKTLRIAEVLLGSVRPGELMAGKLLGGVAVALTLAAIYFGGAYYVALTQGMAGYVTPATIGWFLFFTVLGTLMYGSMFLAAGAAVTNLKEAQTMMMPVMLLIVLPVSIAAGNLIQDPSGTVATAASFFPFSAPMVMTARIAIPPGVPLWQTFVSALVVILTTVILVWAAGRIFRVGILMQGQGANYADLARWVFRG